MSKYVYKRPWGKYEAKIHLGGGKLEYVGIYETRAEAEYQQIMAERGHHWQGMPKVVPDDVFGFTYCMTHKETGRMYLGAKQLFFWSGPRGGYKCSDPRDPEFDKTLWIESDWRTYTGSSKTVKGIVEKEGPQAFYYDVTKLHHNKLELFHGELEEQLEADVLNATDDNGDYVYLNEQVMGVEYRPIVPRAKLRLVRESSQQAVRDYYLRPNVCDDCGTVIPFGQSRCTNAPMFGNGGCAKVAQG